MSADFLPVKSHHFFGEIYHGEWKLTNLLSYKNKKLTSLPFSPLSSLDVKFFFEIWFSDYTTGSNQYSLLKFVLIKVDDCIVPSSLKLEIEQVKVEYSDGQILKEFRGLPIVNVKEMDNYYFEEIRTEYKYNYTGIWEFSAYGKKLNDNVPLLLKCRIKLFDHLEVSSSNRLLPPVSITIKNAESSSDDVKSFKRNDKSSDILICVGSKLFLAHKAVLANHSPVLKQMISQKSEDETALDLDVDLCDAFDGFMDYFYSAEFECTSWPKLRDLYVLSSKYEVDALKKKCSDALLSQISVDKVSEILKVACDYEDLSLKEPSVKFAAEHIRDIISSEKWKELIVSHPLAGHEVILNALNI